MGPADICVEIISPESIERDYHTKKEEYEKGGVREYWIIDWIEQECTFYRLDENGVYIMVELNEGETFTSEILPNLSIHVPTLWQAKLPGPRAISQAVEDMLK
jgi:Uma2 family endonuclease